MNARNEAIATTEMLSAGLFNAGVMVANAVLGGAVRATLDGTVTSSSQVTVKAVGANYVEARNDATVVGGFGGLSASVVNAEIGSSADVEALALDANDNDAITSSGAVEVSAQSANHAVGYTDVAAGGLLSVGVSVPTASVRGGTNAKLESNVSGASGVTVKATSANTAEATSHALTIGGIAVAVTSGDALVGSDDGTTGETTARILANATISAPGGDVLVSTDATNRATAIAEGLTGGLVSVSVLAPTAKVNAPASATFDGTVPEPASGPRTATVKALARGQNVVDADGRITSIKLAGGDGVIVTAEVGTGADVVAAIGAAAHITVSGSVTADAALTPDADGFRNRANAHSKSTGAGLITVGVLIADAKVAGSVRGVLDGKVHAAGSVTVLATSGNEAVATTAAVGIGLLSVSVAGAHAEVTSDATTEVTGASGALIDVTGAIKLAADGTNTATAFSDATTGGLFSLSIDAPEAVVNAPTKAQFDGTVADGTSMELTADSTNTVESTSKVLTVAIVGAQGGTAEATIDDGADTSAILNGNVSTGALSGKLTVKATSLNRASAISGGEALGVASITVIRPAATDRADTIAELNGNVGSTHVDPAAGTVGDAGAAEIEVKAFGDDGTLAKVDTLAVGVARGQRVDGERRDRRRRHGASSAPAASRRRRTSPCSPTRNPTRTRSRRAISGGVIDIQAGLDASAKTDPFASATVEGGFVQAGETHR